MNLSPESRFKSIETRVGLYRADADAELILLEHRAAMACFDLADMIRNGVQLYDSITCLDHEWRKWVFRDELPYCEVFEKRIERLFATWLETSSRIVGAYEQLKNDYHSRGFDKDIVLALSKAVREIRGATTPDAEFFVGDKIVSLRDGAIDEFQAGNCETVV